MHQWIRSHLTYANVIVTVLAFVVLGGGTALASFVVSSNNQVGPGTIAGHKPPKGDHANIISGSVNGQDLATGAVTAAKVANNTISSPKIVNGSVGQVDLSTAARGARAYGLYFGSVTRSKNVVSVDNPSTGIYCVRVAASINPSQATLIPSTDFANDNTSDAVNQVAHAEWNSSATDCPAGRLEVMTWVDVNDTQAKNVNGCTGCTVSDTFRNLELANEGFSFVVP